MENEDFVTYEQAVRLKELGFDIPCSHYYECAVLTSQYEYISGDGGYEYELSVENFYNSVNKNCPSQDLFDAPTLAQTTKWLREVKGLFINIWLCASGFGWVIEKYGNPNYNGTFVAQHNEESGDDKDSGLFTTYEKALSAGIDAALEMIK